MTVGHDISLDGDMLTDNAFDRESTTVDGRRDSLDRNARRLQRFR